MDWGASVEERYAVGKEHEQYIRNEVLGRGRYIHESCRQEFLGKLLGDHGPLIVVSRHCIFTSCVWIRYAETIGEALHEAMLINAPNILDGIHDLLFLREVPISRGLRVDDDIAYDVPELWKEIE